MTTTTQTRLQIAAPLLLLAAACVHQGATSRTTAQPPTQTPPVESAPSPAQAPAAPVTAPAPPAPESAPTVPQPSAPASAASPAARGRASASTPAATATPSSAPPAAARAAPAPGAAAPAPTPPAAAPAAAPPAAALDLAGLEQRLRDTRAIGVFTKLSLKNQVDDLLTQFRSYHQGGSKVTLAQLRQKYEVLLMKVVTLLQDGDPSLATAVSSSRDAIWNVLTDPKKFANI